MAHQTRAMRVINPNINPPNSVCIHENIMQRVEEWSANCSRCGLMASGQMCPMGLLPKPRYKLAYVGKILARNRTRLYIFSSPISYATSDEETLVLEMQIVQILRYQNQTQFNRARQTKQQMHFLRPNQRPRMIQNVLFAWGKWFPPYKNRMYSF